MQRCPLCRARLRQEESCPRCGLDLTMLLAIRRQASALEGQALAALARGDAGEARQRLRRALTLEANERRRLLAAFLAG